VKAIINPGGLMKAYTIAYISDGTFGGYTGIIEEDVNYKHLHYYNVRLLGGTRDGQVHPITKSWVRRIAGVRNPSTNKNIEFFYPE
jgi:hypothetical protein